MPYNNIAVKYPTWATEANRQRHQQKYRRLSEVSMNLCNLTYTTLGGQQQLYQSYTFQAKTLTSQHSIQNKLSYHRYLIENTTTTIKKQSIVIILPLELLAISLSYLDGYSLIAASMVCRAFCRMSQDPSVWRIICQKNWPLLQYQTLPQLPGAPDYDILRLYGGSWRSCFINQYAKSQSISLSVNIDNFSNLQTNQVDKIVSPTVCIGEHHFCLWIFPNGNPYEEQYAGNVLSVYLVLTDLEKRSVDWLTCAVFTLTVVNYKNPSKNIEWHSRLSDNKFNQHLNNWGVHSIGQLSVLKNPENGFLQENNTLTVTARVRLMSMTFRFLFAANLQEHHGLGLANLSKLLTIELPFCSTLNDILAAIEKQFPCMNRNSINLWCFNHPVISGQALRPRKLLTYPGANLSVPVFGRILNDGIDIDAYSNCLIYVETIQHQNSNVHESLSSYQDPLLIPHSEHINSPTTSQYEVDVSPRNNNGFVFVKFFNSAENKINYIGRIPVKTSQDNNESLVESDRKYMSGGLNIREFIKIMYTTVANYLKISRCDLIMFKEDIAPSILIGPIFPNSIDAHCTSYFVNHFDISDIFIFTINQKDTLAALRLSMNNMLRQHYILANELANSAALTVPSLTEVEELAEKLDIPKFRVRGAFRKCNFDIHRTLRYIMVGRHLGFICDACGETDFQGARHNCTICNDYDLCQKCYDKREELNYRYANVEGTWKRVYQFEEHKMSHTMRQILPVFHSY